jgi:hypothetical protein
MIPKTPQAVSDERLQLAYDYARLGERETELKLLKADIWLEIRKKCSSDTQAEKEWDRTDFGKELITIQGKMKVKKIQISALKSKLDVLNHEAFNQW